MPFCCRLHELALCLMCKDLDDLKQVARWDGISGNSRRQVLLSLQVSAGHTIFVYMVHVVLFVSFGCLSAI